MCDHGLTGNHCCHSGSEDALSSFSLYKFIDLHGLECLNESVPGSGKLVFKPYESRNESTVYVESDLDQELLFNVPFTGNVKLKGIIIAGENGGCHPNRVTLYKNRPFMTFTDVDVEFDQQLDLAIDPNGDVVYPLKPARFNSVHSLSIFVHNNHGGDVTRIHYIGLRGDFTPAPRREVVIANYEVTPNIADHKLEFIQSHSHIVE